MAKRTVLAIGIEPAFADFTAFPQLTRELIRNYVHAQIEQLRAIGHRDAGRRDDVGDRLGHLRAVDRIH